MRSTWLLLAALNFTASGALATDKRLIVFLPSLRPPAEMEKALKADAASSSLDTAVFGRYTDAATAIGLESPPYLIAPAQLVAATKGYEAVAHFTRQGKEGAPLLLLSLGPPWTAAKTAEGTVGVLEELDRKLTKGFLDSVLKGKSFKAIKRVTKTEDLLPLLALGNSDYILISADAYAEQKQKFSTQVETIGQSSEVAFPVLAVRSGAAPAQSKDLLKLAPSTVKSLGYDGLKEVKRGKAKP